MGVWFFCGAFSPILCSHNIEDEQAFRIFNSENKLVARESPGGHITTFLIVEEPSPLSEHVVRLAERHDNALVGGAVKVNDEQELSAEQRFASNELNACRNVLAALWRWRESLQRHRSQVCDCDECVAVAESAREPVALMNYRARVAQSVRCTHVEQVQRFLSSASDQHIRIAHLHVNKWDFIKYSVVEALHFEPLARVATKRYQLHGVSWWLHD